MLQHCSIWPQVGQGAATVDLSSEAGTGSSGAEENKKMKASSRGRDLYIPA